MEKSIEEKISTINTLKREVEELKKFLRQVEISGGYYQRDEKKKNKAYELSIKSYIYTGDDNPSRHADIYNHDDILQCINVDVLKQIIETKENIIKDMLK